MINPFDQNIGFHFKNKLSTLLTENPIVIRLGCLKESVEHVNIEFKLIVS